MERYKLNGVQKVPTLAMRFINRHNKDDCKVFMTSIGDLVSILYIDKLYEIDEKKEYVIHGRITRFMREEIDTSIGIVFRYFIQLDASDDGVSHKVNIAVDNILDIHPYEYHYDLEEKVTVFPKRLTDGFYVKESTTPQNIDITVPNDPLLGDKDFDYYEYNEEEGEYVERKPTKMDET